LIDFAEKLDALFGNCLLDALCRFFDRHRAGYSDDPIVLRGSRQCDRSEVGETENCQRGNYWPGLEHEHLPRGNNARLQEHGGARNSPEMPYRLDIDSVWL
jgi:hypothetical protein